MPTLTLLLDRKPLQVYERHRSVIRVGRADDMDIVIDNVAVSREQAEIRQESGLWMVQDLGSANGTFLNGQRLAALQPLRPGDEISFGKFSLLFERLVTEPVAREATAPRPVAAVEGTLILRPEEIERLQQMAAQKRRAQLRWQVRRRQGTHHIEGGAALVGRSALCDLRVSAGRPNPYVLLVVRGVEGFEVRNLSRWYRMRVNGQVRTRAALDSGDTITVGRLRLTFMDEVR